MVGIMTNTEPVTLINVFEVPQDELDAFAADWHTRAIAHPGLYRVVEEFTA
ncbi:hypothetical protein BN979_02246 [Mycolicibacterium vulneris]|nr:hypothetical protein BN979_02246 [Mycolicibacterium vulneris]